MLFQIIEKYGADALRVYLVNSPAVRGEALRFREEGVKDVLKDVFLPWYNAYRFFVQNVQAYEHVTYNFLRKLLVLLTNEKFVVTICTFIFTCQNLIRFYAGKFFFSCCFVQKLIVYVKQFVYSRYDF